MKPYAAVLAVAVFSTAAIPACANNGPWRHDRMKAGQLWRGNDRQAHDQAAFAHERMSAGHRKDAVDRTTKLANSPPVK